MPDTQILFIAVGATGFLILLISVLLGGFGDNADLAHGYGEIAHGEGDVGGSAADAGHGVPEGSAQVDTPHWLSVRVLSVSLVGCGATGFAAAYAGLPALLTWPLAAVGFLAVGAAAHRYILKPLARQQYNSLSSRWGWVGRTGVVTLEILPHGTGQVTFNDRDGARITQTATSDLGEGIPRGSAVTVTDLTDGGVVVHRSSFSG